MVVDVCLLIQALVPPKNDRAWSLAEEVREPDRKSVLRLLVEEVEQRPCIYVCQGTVELRQVGDGFQVNFSWRSRCHT